MSPRVHNSKQIKWILTCASFWFKPSLYSLESLDEILNHQAFSSGRCLAFLIWLVIALWVYYWVYLNCYIYLHSSVFSNSSSSFESSGFAGFCLFRAISLLNENSSFIGTQSLIIKICFRFPTLQFSSFVVLDSFYIDMYIVKELIARYSKFAHFEKSLFSNKLI